MKPNLYLIIGDDDDHPELLEIRRVHHPGVDVLFVAGEIDSRTAPMLQRQLRAGGPAALVCDLTGVRFLGISGLSVVLRAAALASLRGRRFGVVTNARAVLRLVRCSGAAGLEVFDSLPAAVRALRGPRDDWWAGGPGSW